MVHQPRDGVGGDGTDRRGRIDITTLKQIRMITHLKGEEGKYH